MGYFWKKNVPQELWKIAQSGHTGHRPPLELTYFAQRAEMFRKIDKNFVSRGRFRRCKSIFQQGPKLQSLFTLSDQLLICYKEYLKLLIIRISIFLQHLVDNIAWSFQNRKNNFSVCKLLQIILFNICKLLQLNLFLIKCCD